MTQTEVLVIGAGPAGIAAASTAAELGRKVVVLDDNPAPGGQVWRGGVTAPAERGGAKEQALARLSRSGGMVHGGYRVFDAEPGVVQALYEGASSRNSGTDSRTARVTFRYEQLILATGARERFLPFPGWTLPGVFGAGGLQALVQGGFSVAARRVVVAGTGPLLLAVGAHLQGYGAEVVCVAEQASLGQLAPFALALLAQPGKVWQGLRYRAALRRTAYRTHCWPVEALAHAGESRLQAVRLTDGRRTWKEPCDLLACGFHLVPNTEVAALLGCAFEGSFVQVDEQQQTSVPGVYCAGEPTGIRGLEAALLQGAIAGRACAGQRSGGLERRASAERGFGARLEKAFALRPELRLLATPETMVCRCEDVPLGRLIAHSGWRDAKLQTRCGMGPCQGRICGPALETLLGWKAGSVRPPLFPVPLEALCAGTHLDHAATHTTTEEIA